MRRRIVVGTMLSVVALGIWLAIRETPSSEPTRESPVGRPSDRPVEERAPTVEPPSAPEKVSSKRRVTKREREEYRRRILEGLRAREEARDAAPTVPSRAPVHEPEAPAPGKSLTDRSDGKLAYYMKTLNEDLLPLADECYELARADDPSLRGMLDIRFQVIADEEVGGLVESVEVGEENEIHNAALLECMRESTLSTIFPAPQASGREGVRLTLIFEPEPPADSK